MTLKHQTTSFNITLHTANERGQYLDIPLENVFRFSKKKVGSSRELTGFIVSGKAFAEVLKNRLARLVFPLFHVNERLIPSSYSVGDIVSRHNCNRLRLSRTTITSSSSQLEVLHWGG